MALKTRRASRWLSRLHFLVRLLGLTGFVAACAGLAVAHTQGLLSSLDGAWQTARAVALGEAEGPLLTVVAAWLVLGGAAAFVLALLVEMLVILRLTAGRRSAFGLNAVVQVAVAAVLLVGINVFSFFHHHRTDLTRDQRFTLPETLRDQLRRLRGDTTVYVVQRRPRTDLGAGDEDYESAAEAVVVDKVRDLVDQLRALGPRFRVVVLDARKKDYRARLKEEAGNDDALRGAIEGAPESCVIFYARSDRGPHLQRLNFSDFYRLDRTSSRQENNLVLLPKGVEPFVRRVLNLEEKRPLVGLLVVDPVLTSQSDFDLYTARGLRRSLEANRFEVRDVVLKDLRTDTPTAELVEENKFRELQLVKSEITQLANAIERFKSREKEWNDPKQKLDDLNKKYSREIGGTAEEEDRPRVIAFYRLLRQSVERRRQKAKEEQTRLEKETAAVDEEAVKELKRLNDVKDKLGRTLADCDLLIIPRYTRLPFGRLVAGDVDEVYRLDKAHLDVLKDFLKSGKPILACLGPVNRPGPPAPREADGLEQLLAELGIRCADETVLFDADEAEGEGRPDDDIRGRGSRRIPPLEFDSVTEGTGSLKKSTTKPNPLQESLHLARRALGEELEVKLHYLRPISYDATEGLPRGRAAGPLATVGGAMATAVVLPSLPVPEGSRDPFAAGFLFTGLGSRRTDRPFDRSPAGTVAAADEKMRGPVAVGVAVEVPLPASWRAAEPTVRVAVIGHGGAFVEPVLPVPREKLLLDTCNWLLGRDDLLTTVQREPSKTGKEVVWSYPRVQSGEREKTLWLWATRLGLPVLFAWLGLVVLMRRRLR